MVFTYEGYKELLKLLAGHNYRFTDYKSWQQADRCVILRHDIDYDIDKAVRLAAEEENEGVASTYFVLLTSDFYNVFSKKDSDKLKRILDYGHTIGLHFDEARYPETAGDTQKIKKKITEEAGLLGKAIERKIDIVSMHRPSRAVLEADMNIPGMINSYGTTYFKEFKYLSDSRRRWREPLDKIIESGKYRRLHILTHAFWYNEIEKDMHQTVLDVINSGNHARYRSMDLNITDLSSIVSESEVT